MPDTGLNIDEAKKRAIREILQRIDQMGEAAYSIMLEEIEEIFDFKAGKIISDKTFVKQLNKLTVQVLDLLQSDPKFSGPVSAFVKRMPDIAEEISSFQNKVNGVKVPDFEIAKKVVIDETMDQMLNNGLNQNFVQPLRDLVYQNVTRGLSYKEAKEQLKEYIEGGNDKSGKLGSYIEQTAQQATDTYSGVINKKILETFKMDGLLITGSLIDNSSPQCRFAIEELGGKITRENWPQVVEKATKRFPLIEGTTFDNLPLFRLHHGCRHSFFPVIIKKDS